MDLLNELYKHFEPKSIAKELKEIEKLPFDKVNYDYDHDEDGNMLSCCGDVLDPDIMICPTCKEHN